MRYQSVEAGESWAVVGKFVTGRTVNVTMYNAETGATIATTGNATEIGTTGFFRANNTLIDTDPTDLTTILVVLQDSTSGLQDPSVVVVGGYPDGIVASQLQATAGSSSTEVRTGATQANDFYDNMILVVKNTAGIAARVITNYANTNGAFTVDPALPFTPAVGDEVFVLNGVAVDARLPEIANEVWDEALPGSHGAGTAGERLASTDDTVGTNLDATVSTRSQPGDAMDLVTDAVDATAVATSGANEVRDAILSDSNPFAGALIDAAITSRASQASLDVVDQNVDDLEAALVAAQLTAVAGSSATEVRTGATQADDFYNDMLLVVRNAAGVAVRRIVDYANSNGAFTVAALPFTPAASDPVVVLNVLDSSGQVANAVWSEALPGGFGAGTAGERLATTDDTVGSNLDAAVSTRAAPGDEMDLVTDAVDANSVATTGAQEIRDEILDDGTRFSGADIDAAITSREAAGASATAEANIRGADNRNLTQLAGAGFVQGTDSQEAIRDAIDALQNVSAADVTAAVWGITEATLAGAGETGELLLFGNTLRSDIDFTGSDSLGWQLVVFDRNNNEIARANLFDEAFARIPAATTVAAFINARKAIARVDII